jgi:hypothetical protein
MPQMVTTLSRAQAQSEVVPTAASRLGAGLALSGMVVVWVVGLIPAAIYCGVALAVGRLTPRRPA